MSVKERDRCKGSKKDRSSEEESEIMKNKMDADSGRRERDGKGEYEGEM